MREREESHVMQLIWTWFRVVGGRALDEFPVFGCIDKVKYGACESGGEWSCDLVGCPGLPYQSCKTPLIPWHSLPSPMAPFRIFMSHDLLQASTEEDGGQYAVDPRDPQ